MQGLATTSGKLAIATDYDLLQSSLERLLFVELGTQVGALDQGSRIPRYFWEAADARAAMAILAEAKALIMRCESRIKLTGVGVELQTLDNKAAIVLTIKFYWANDGTQTNQDMKFVKVRDM